MADNTTNTENLYFEIIKPSKIESEVPGEQKLREYHQQEISTEKKMVENDTDTFVPVITVTKKEVVFTKGDTKLQKITDTQPANVKVENPFYSEIQAQTLEAPQRIRSYEFDENGDNVRAEIRKTTRKPSYRFKQIADKFKEDSNNSEREVYNENLRDHPRRSSIPRLIRSQSTVKEKSEVCNNNQTQQTTTINNNKQDEEDEFEKIYHEVVEDEKVVPVFENVLNEVKIEDPDKLESNFDEIVHEYVEGKLQPLSLDSVRQSRIPLPRRKSQGHEIKRDNRRFNKSLSVDNSKIKTYPRDDFNSMPYAPSNDTKTSTFNRRKDNCNTLIPVFKNKTNEGKSMAKDNDKPRVIATNFDSDHEHKPTEYSNTFNDTIKIVQHISHSNDDEKQIDLINDNKQATNGNESSNRDISEDISKGSELINIYKNIELNKDIIRNGIPKKKSVSSRIAMFERQDPNVSEIRIPQPKQIIKAKSTENLIIHGININDKPRIIEEVLKSPFRKNFERNIFEENEANLNEADDTVKNDDTIDNVCNKMYESKVSQTGNEEQAVIFKSIEVERCDNFNKQSEIKNVKQNIDEVTFETIPTKNNDCSLGIEHLNLSKATESYVSLTPDESLINYEPKVNLSKNTTKLPYENIENRLKRFQSIQEDRKKSISDLDLALMQGKVKAMIVRMNPLENLNECKDSKMLDKPRKKAVSGKIALFENKITPIKMEETIPNETSSFELQEEKVEVNYAEKIEELKNAKNKYGVTTKMEYVELNNGLQMPVLAVGTALLDPRLVHHIVTAAIDLGYRAIDTAFIYGNEKQVGMAIREKIEDGTVKREDLFIMSKLWSTFHRRDLVERACRESLERMGLEYFDLFMIHNPMSFKEGSDPLPKIANVLQYSSQDYLDAWYGMEELVSKGLVKSIGVSNFNSVQIARVVEKGKIKPVVNQVECHPYLNQQRLDNFCAERGVKLSCYGTLGSKGTPEELKSGIPAVIDDPIVLLSAAALEVSPAQLLIRYQIDRDHNVVVKSSTAARLVENLQTLETELDSEKVEALNALNKNKRNFTFKGMGDTHRNYPFKIAF